MWDVNHGWKWDSFASYLPEQTLKIIASYSLLPDLENEDHTVWAASISGKITIKSILSVIGESTSDDNDPI